MKVVKFGGSSVASAGQIRKVCDIVLSDAVRKIVVVSAPGKSACDAHKVTDMLIAAAKARLAGGTGCEELQRVVARYAAIAEELALPSSLMEEIAADLQGRLAMDTCDADAFMDNMKASGEDNCAKLVAQYFRTLGVEASYVCPKQAGLLLSDEPGNARVLPQSYTNLQSLRQQPGLLIFPGFFGYAASGRLVTFPRGGSDITGAILAAAVQAELYENFTDVDSVYVTNPKIVANPKPVSEITYREMRELSYAGFSVFHDEALEPVFHAGIPVAIKNTNNPSAPGTRLVMTRDYVENPVVGIAGSDGFCSVYVSKYLMNREIGFGRRLLQIFEEAGVSFEHNPSGIDNMSVIVPEEQFSLSAEEHVLGRIRTELEVDEITVERGMALVMVVGEGMHHTVGLAGRACMAFAQAGVNIEMINQGASEVSIMFGIKASDVTRAVQSLYSEFFGMA